MLCYITCVILHVLLCDAIQHVMSCYITFYVVMLYNIICYVMFCHAIQHVMSCYMTFYVMSCYITFYVI